MISKDRFLTQSAPDIRRKLLKQVYGPNQSLDTLLQLAQTVYYGREYEEMKERQKRTKEQVEALAMAMKTVLKQPEKNAQRDPGEKDGLAVTVERSGTSSGIALRHLNRPAPCPVCKGPHWKRDCPQRCRFQGLDSQDNQD